MAKSEDCADELSPLIQRHITARELAVRAEIKSEMSEKFRIMDENYRLLDEKCQRMDAQLQELVSNSSTIQRCQV